MKIKRNISSIVIVSILCLFAGCGGGGSDSSNSNGQPDGPINSGLEGSVILGGRGWVLDLATGNYSRVPGVEAWDENPDYLGIATVDITARAFSGEQIVETVSGCQHEDNTHSNLECVILHDASGNLLDGFLFKPDIIEPVKLSRDGRYLAVVRRYGDTTSDIYLEIHDPTINDIISYANLGHGVWAQFDWLPDNRIVYALGQSIYITESLATNGTPIVQFDASDGTPEDLSASPDGERIVFVLRTFGNYAASHGYVWTMDISGNNPKRPAVVPGNSDPIMNHPAWSPDGKWILVVEGDVRSGNDTSGVLYAVPADGVDVPLVLESESTTAIPIFSRFGQVLEIESELSSDFQNSGELFWVSK